MKARMVLIALLSATTLVGVGCTTMMMDSGTDSSAVYRFGRLTAEEQKPLSTVYAAAESAMTKLGLSVVSKVKDELEANITARDAQDRKIIVELVSVAKDATEITVRVSSAEKAQRIYQTIREEL
jgi:hypothetical protein